MDENDEEYIMICRLSYMVSDLEDISSFGKK